MLLAAERTELAAPSPLSALAVMGGALLVVPLGGGFMLPDL